MFSELEEEEAEENRRKQREEQYQKERMTLGETRKQITSLERHLDKLRDEKHQLFLQLKKVLNEENAMRKRRFEEMRYFALSCYCFLAACSCSIDVVNLLLAVNSVNSTQLCHLVQALVEMLVISSKFLSTMWCQHLYHPDISIRWGMLLVN